MCGEGEVWNHKYICNILPNKSQDSLEIWQLKQYNVICKADIPFISYPFFLHLILWTGPKFTFNTRFCCLDPAYSSPPILIIPFPLFSLSVFLFVLDTHTFLSSMLNSPTFFLNNNFKISLSKNHTEGTVALNKCWIVSSSNRGSNAFWKGSACNCWKLAVMLVN